MIYYIFLALIDIGLYLYNHWTELTFTVASTAIGIIVGRRIGTRLAYGYALRLLGINHKSTLERKVEWLIEQERGRGNIWSASTSKRYKLNIRASLSKSFILLQMAQFIARYTGQSTNGRKSKMNLLKSNLSKKLTTVIATTLLIAFNDKFQLGMSQDTIFVLAGLAATYVAGQSAVDAKKAQLPPVDESTQDQFS